MVKRTSLEELYTETADELTSILESDQSAAVQGELRSPDLIDKIVWGVLIAFAVSSAANVFTSVVLGLVSRKLTADEVDKIRAAASKSAIEIGEIDDHKLESAVFEQLPTSMRDETRRSLAKRILDVLKTHILRRG